ncbi:MAG: L-2-hydroxyglutarate oxidase [Desulfovibrio sp.]|uniref:L-2-hydroxyglutarate oxidase n=1 Tax=Desulfovibrio sp. 7SRBS1 TaxID=3378064 RepID=UPI003B3CFE1E
MKHANIIICGGGIVGLTIARELLKRGHEDIIVLEKEKSLGKHASGRNSGVLHTGVYYAPDTLKAQTCLEGNHLLQAYCLERGLPLQKTGKVIVATEPDRLSTLQELYQRAKTNGAKINILDVKELQEIEPNACTFEKALLSPETCVFSPTAVLESVVEELHASGKVFVLTDHKVKAIIPGRRILHATRERYEYNFLINTCGAYSDKLAHAFGLGSQYAILPFKGLYRRLKAGCNELVRGSIYPVPDIRNPFLGIHFTKGVDGTVYIGPTSTPAFARENYGILQGLDWEAPLILARDAMLFATNAKFRAIALSEPLKYYFPNFFRDAKKLVKKLVPDNVEASSKVGIRPQLVDLKKRELVMDFLVERNEDSLHVLNAISPAFTASMSFARMVTDKYLGNVV